MSHSFEYIRPRSRSEAIEILARPGSRAAPLIIHPKPAAPRQMGVAALLDLSLLELDYLQEAQDGTFHIGALATLQEMMESPELNTGCRSILGQAAGLAAGPGIRNLSGLWGTIQAQNGPPEIFLALLVLEARIILLGKGEVQRTIDFLEFCNKSGTLPHKGELVLEASIPPKGFNLGWALERVSRTPRDEAIVAAAAIIEALDGNMQRVTLALADANPFPRRLLSVEAELTGKPFTTSLMEAVANTVQAQAEPVGDFRGSPEYRCAMAGLVTRRALERAWERATTQNK